MNIPLPAQEDVSGTYLEGRDDIRAGLERITDFEADKEFLDLAWNYITQHFFPDPFCYTSRYSALRVLNMEPGFDCRLHVRDAIYPENIFLQVMVHGNIDLDQAMYEGTDQLAQVLDEISEQDDPSVPMGKGFKLGAVTTGPWIRFWQLEADGVIGPYDDRLYHAGRECKSITEIMKTFQY